MCDLDIVLYVLRTEKDSGPTVACRLDSSEQPPFRWADLRFLFVDSELVLRSLGKIC